ncbi:MAG: SpoIIE family protein phosphatase, partial [Spirochaetia bacterium]|nr:SpoIIE family protein phosphatase [Spirochaetia bacterium]
MLFFNSTAVSMLICVIFALVTVAYLVSLKSKSPSTRSLIAFFTGSMLVNLGFFIAAFIPHPLAVYHRFLTVGGALTAVAMMSQFAYRFPRANQVKEARIVFIIMALASLGVFSEFAVKAFRTEPEFFFAGGLFNFPQEMGRHVALTLVSMNAWFLVAMIRRAVSHKGDERRAIIQLTLAMLLPSMGPNIANALYQQGRMDHLTFEQLFVSMTLIGFFFITIVFINNAVERTSFMIKIIGISLVTILMVVQGLTMIVTSSQEKFFDQTAVLQGLNQVNQPEGKLVSEDIAYILSYTEKAGTPAVRIVENRTGATLDAGAMAADIRQSLASGGAGQRLNRRLKEHSTHLYFGYVVPAANGAYLEVGYPMLTYRAFIDVSARKIGLTLLVVSAVIVILYPIFFSRSLVRPLNTLVTGVGEVNTGNLTVKIPVLVQDEIGYLSESFNRMVVSILDAKNELQRYAETLEDKVKERTREVTVKMEEIQALKVQQDGDYYLTSLIERPLETNWNKSRMVETSFYIEQKKKFSFRNRSAELGGDICITGNLRFGEEGQRYIVFLNGDAMGKSMQGAGGAIVLGTTMNNIMARSSGVNLMMTPEEWLTQAHKDLDNVFKTFDGLMLVSAVLGLINEKTGKMWFFNAEHPWTVLYRDGKASFIENELLLRKLGSPSEFQFKVRSFQLEPGDVLLVGSDGRDDLNMSPDSSVRAINEDESLFLRHVEGARADLQGIVKAIKAAGEITDDLSLLKIGFHTTSEAMGGEGEALFEKGRVSLDEGRTEEGISLLESAIAAAPDHAEALRLLARTHFEKADFDKAAERTLEYLELRPEDADAWLQLTMSYRNIRDYEQAKASGEKLRSLQPER